MREKGTLGGQQLKRTPRFGIKKNRLNEFDRVGAPVRKRSST